MADSILKLKVDDKEYNASLRNARQGMAALEQSLQQAGKSFSDVDSNVVEYVRAIGNMNTQSTTAKGKIGEMSTAFTEMSMQYKRMTEQEKASPVGKALSESLDQLKGRIQQTKKDLDDVTRSLNTTDVAVKQNSSDSAEYGNVLQSLAGKFGVNVTALTGWGAALGAATVALKVMKDAFFNNEQYLDEWGRTVESVESVYNGFLNSLNTGDVSGFLVNIQTITKAARDAYDALDELATFNAFNKANIAGARADLSGAIADYRENKGSKELVQKASDELIKELETRQQLQAEAYKKVVAEVARQRQVNPEDLLKVMTGQWGSFKELKELEYTGRKSILINTGGTYASGPQFKTITEAVPSNDRERLAQAVKHLNDTEIENLQSLAEAAKITQVEINNQRKMVARVLNGRKGGTAGGGGGTTKTGGGAASWSPIAMQEVGMVSLGRSVNDINADLAKAQRAYNDAGDAIGRAAAKAMVEKLQGELTGVKNEGDVTKGGFADAYNYDFSKVLKEFDVNTDGLDEANKKTKKLEEAANNAAKAARSIGQAFSSIEDPAANIMGMIAEAIATVALTFSKSLKGTVDPWEWIAAAAAGTATMISTIAAIQSNAGNFANGGIVPGNSFTGDNMIAHVNSGELILDKAKQDSIANLLTQNENGVGGYMGVPYVNGENIILGVNNTFSRKGKGEVVTTGMLKKMGVI